MERIPQLPKRIGPDILLLGASQSEFPLLESATRLGLTVQSMGTTRCNNFPRENHHYIDYSNIEAVTSAAIEINPRSIVSGCNDFASTTVAEVSYRLQIPTHLSVRQAKLLHNKADWQRVFGELGIPVPQTVILHSFDEYKEIRQQEAWMNRKLILKPVDLTGGKGIRKVEDSLSEVEFSSVTDKSKASRVLLQEYVHGTLHSAMMVISRKKEFIMFADEIADKSNKVRCALLPSSLPKEKQQEITSQMRRATSSLGLTTGILHIQFIYNGKDHFVIDLCGRPPGDLYILLAKYAYNFDLAAFWVKPNPELIPWNFEETNETYIRLVGLSSSKLLRIFLQSKISEFNSTTVDELSKRYVSSHEISFYKISNWDERILFSTYVHQSLGV